jgi:hypothetical protein
MTRKRTVKRLVAGALILAVSVGGAGAAGASDERRHDIDDLVAIAQRGPGDGELRVPPGIPGRATDTCADRDGYTLWLRHEAHLQWWTTMEPVGPKGDGWDLTFDICTTSGTPIPDDWWIPEVRYAIDQFIAVLQTHYETRGTSYHSPLTDCFNEFGADPTWRIPEPLTGEPTPAAHPDWGWMPIIGFDLLFTKDPQVSIILFDELTSGALAFPMGFPTDPQPQSDRNEIWVRSNSIHVATTLTNLLAHELSHRMGYDHGDDDSGSMADAIGHCFSHDPFK